MKFLASLFLLATSALAVPVANSNESKHFHLKSTGATNADHNNLYVYAYHTGAGLNDAVLTKNASKASSVYLNGTNANFDLKTEFSWGVVATGNTNYACESHIPSSRLQNELTRFSIAWQPITINAGTGSDGFSVKDNKFQWSEDSGFGGWLSKDSPASRTSACH